MKDPEYPDTLYVSDLVAAGTVNTMPRATMEAFADHGRTVPDSAAGQAEQSAEVFRSLAGVGVDLDDVFALLEREGVEKFVTAWDELSDAVAGQVSALR